MLSSFYLYVFMPVVKVRIVFMGMIRGFMSMKMRVL